MTGADGQTVASRPGLSAWVDASAGTGKTKVLVDRVLRLLLAGTAPERILCLTFTRAAAAEMANRIHGTLGDWVRADEAVLRGALTRLIEAAPDEAVRERARSLFLHVLDSPGGIRIQTIHSFCEGVLGRFPLEARIAPHFEVMDERSAQETLRTARDRVIGEAAAGIEEALATISVRLREDRFDRLMASLGANRGRLLAMAPPDEGAIYRCLGRPVGQTAPEVIAAATEDAAFDGEGLDRAVAALSRGSRTDRRRADAIEAWITDPNGRIAGFSTYAAAFLTGKGEIPAKLATKPVVVAAPEVPQILRTEAGRIGAVREASFAAATAEASTALARLAARLMDAYDAEKRSRARLDYEDLITHVRRLLRKESAAAWVLYKLDGGIDHVLIDEAQDTSPDQWAVIRALTGDFFAGQSAREAGRTVFAVGDPKQSIFSFQGADPAWFAAMRDHFRGRVEAGGAGWETIALEVSFRSTAPVLRLVDAVFADPDTRRGLSGPPIRHRVHRIGQAGEVVLWPPATARDSATADPFDPDARRAAYAPSSWRLAQAIAETIATWIGSHEMLPSRGRPIRAGDILILVRRRTAFFEQLVRALKAREIGVAGIDRLVLARQLAVKDLLALGEAALLPHDDLTMGAVLKGPLIGLDEEALFDLAHERGRTSLFARLAALGAEDPDFSEAHERLRAILAQADYVPPFEFYTHILSAMDGRSRLLARLGPDAEDSIDEFLNLALDYESTHPPSLQGFISWFRAAATEVKRDLEQTGRDEVRIMTVHGAKGLEAPIVMLADTMQTPADISGLLWPDDERGRPVLLWRPRRGEEDPRTSALREEAERHRDEEYRRLLYVAMTRAQDRLHVCGYTTGRTASQSCWYRIIERALEPLAEPFEMTLAAPEIDGWSGRALRLTCPQDAPPDRADPPAAEAEAVHPLPDWTQRPAPPEPPASRAAAPSRLDGHPGGGGAPLGTDGGAGLRRGRIVHDLLRALPDIDPERRAPVMAAHLSRPVLALSPAEQEALAREVLGVLATPEVAPLFGPEARAEAPIAGWIGNRLFSGRIDRLLIGQTEIHLVDFKTDQKPPARTKDVPAAYLRQLAAYRALLEKIHPDRPIRCALIWTAAPRVMAIPAALLDNHPP